MEVGGKIRKSESFAVYLNFASFLHSPLRSVGRGDISRKEVSFRGLLPL